jgi:hypothetical protein
VTGTRAVVFGMSASSLTVDEIMARLERPRPRRTAAEEAEYVRLLGPYAADYRQFRALAEGRSRAPRDQSSRSAGTAVLQASLRKLCEVDGRATAIDPAVVRQAIVAAFGDVGRRVAR